MSQRMFLLRAAATSFVLLLGCSTAQPPAAPDTRAADEKAIRDGEAQWVKDFASKDPEKVLAHYADDADSMIPEMKLMSGHGSP
jgi:hypothetical protein